ncbi:serine hydrolase domain-containing protein [Elioraea rosea]|uniref:serine hydrolase domain-containing protein n=1 Tax=Elioraea rosea TaxID=2492390 RepID=UPI001183F0D6|nr:serine hydrolase domain-containing protein [Elioraea rosea]
MTTPFLPRRAALAGAGLALLAGGKASAQIQLAQAPQAAAPTASPAVTPSATSDAVRGFSKARLARIRGVMEAEAARNSFPGAVTLIARQGEVIHLEAHGHLDAAKTKPLTTDAIFLQASMTKPIVSTLAMMLVEQGRMKLDDPVHAYLPELAELKVEMRRAGAEPEYVQPTRPPTIHDLLRHSAGFIYANPASPSAAIRAAYERHDIEARNGPVPTRTMLQQLGTIPLAFQPGTTFHYSIATDVLGLTLERAAGMRLDRLLARDLTGPLGMADTTWFVPEAKRARVAEAPTTDPQTSRMWRSYRITEDPGDASYFKGGAGLVSTAADYHRYAQMIANGGVFDGVRYLSPATVRFMLSNHIVGMAGTPAGSTGPGYGFGLGFGVRLDDGMGTAAGSPGDAMWAGAWGTSFTIDRAEGLVAILMAQGPSNRFRTRMIFKNLVYGAMTESLRA